MSGILHDLQIFSSMHREIPVRYLSSILTKYLVSMHRQIPVISLSMHLTKYLVKYARPDISV